MNFFDRANASQVVPIRCQRTGTRRRRFFLHDDRRFQAGTNPLHFFFGDAIGQAFQFADGDVERFLGAFGGGARVANDAGNLFERLVIGTDRIAQAALLAHFGE